MITPEAELQQGAAVAGEVPVEQIGAGHQGEPGQRGPITAVDGGQPVALRFVDRGGWQHQQQTTAIAQHEEIGDEEQHRQVGAHAIDIADDPLQGGGQRLPVEEAEHAGVGAQGIAEEARGLRVLDARVVDGIGLLDPLRQVGLAAAGTIRSPQQVPGIEHELEAVLNGGKGRVLPGPWGHNGRLAAGGGLFVR